LGSLGYSVWWNKTLRADQVSVDEIESQLDRAKAVLGVWSAGACDSTLVHAECLRALDAGKLAQARLDTVELPPPFSALPAADLARSEWGPLEDALARIVRDAAPAPPETRALGPLPTPAAAGAPKLIAIAIGAVLAAYSGAVSATAAGVMAPDQLQLAATGVLGVGAVCAGLSAYRLIAVARAGG
jgi:hypothetical protein